MREDTARALKDFNGHTALQKKNVKALEDMLRPGETVLFATATNVVISNAGTRQQKSLPGFAMLTNERFLFSYGVLWEHSIESIALKDIQSVSCSGNSLTGGRIEIQVMTKTFNFLVSYKKEIIRKIQDTFDNARAYAGITAVPVVAPSPADELKKYKELLDMGAISEEEYTEKKRQLLKL